MPGRSILGVCSEGGAGGGGGTGEITAIVICQPRLMHGNRTHRWIVRGGLQFNLRFFKTAHLNQSPAQLGARRAVIRVVFQPILLAVDHFSIFKSYIYGKLGENLHAVVNEIEIARSAYSL